MIPSNEQRSIDLVDAKKSMEKVGLEPMGPHAGTDLKEGEIGDLDQAEIFLRANNITHNDLNAMLEDTAGIKRLVKRVDWLLMPLLCGTYLLQYVDKQVSRIVLCANVSC